jgi:membrane protein required for colicin V production
MNYLDIIFAFLIIVSAVDGFRKGLIHQLASLASLILGVYIAVKFSTLSAPFMQQFFSFSENTALIVSFVVLFIAVAIGVYFIGRSIEGFFEDIELGPINKLTGLVFGIAKTIIILSIVIFLLRLVPFTRNWPSDTSRQKSFLFEKVESVAPAIYPYFLKSDEK